jgi:hypothetical protein
LDAAHDEFAVVVVESGECVVVVGGGSMSKATLSVIDLVGGVERCLQFAP